MVYATKLKRNISTQEVVVEAQIELGPEMSDYVNNGGVVDTQGNYFCYHGLDAACILAKIIPDPPFTQEILYINSGNIGTVNEIYAIALSRNGEYVYIFPKLAIWASYSDIYKIPTDDITSFVLDDINKFNQTNILGSGMNHFVVDKYGYVWLTGENTGKNIYRYDTSGFNKSVEVADRILLTYCQICADANGVVWAASTTITQCFYSIEEDEIDPAKIVLSEISINNCRQTYINDMVAWTNLEDGIAEVDKRRFVYMLKNNKNDNVTACKIIKIDVTDKFNPNNIQELDLIYDTKNLTQCWNLHCDYDGNVYFSTWSHLDGYNTYVVSMINDVMQNPEMFIAGIGSKTNFNDPYGFLLSNRGATGADI